MSRPLGPTFRVRALRDALGLVRLLFAIEREGEDVHRCAALVDVGKELVLALDLGRCGRDSLGYRAGVQRAVEVMARLAAMAWPSEVATLVRVAQARVVGDRPRREDERDAKRRAVAARG